MAENLRVFGLNYQGVEGLKLTDTDGNIVTYYPEAAEPEPLDVDFIDYDGTLLYTYTAQEFLNLTELPPNPSHYGLTAQGWNWSLSDAKTFVGNYGSLVIGQMYTTSNGRTRVYIHMPDSFPIKTIAMRYAQSAQNGTKVYWGDGTEDIKSSSGTVASDVSHTYENSGDYVIEIEVLNGEITALGSSNANTSLLGSGDCRMKGLLVTKIEIGNGVTGLSHNPFKHFSNMKTITFPSSLVNQADYDESIFLDCKALKAIVFPTNYIGRSRGMFDAGLNLRYISVPKNQTGFSINTNHFNLRKLTIANLAPYNNGTEGPFQLQAAPTMTHFVVMGTYTVIKVDALRNSQVKKIYIPETVTSIKATAFAYNYYCEEIHLYPTAPPTLANTNVFNGTTGTFYVPYSADHSILTAYQNETNWSTSASRMVEESA